MPIKIDKKELKMTALVFVLLFFSNDTYLFGTNSNEFMVALPRYLILGYCAVNILFFIANKKYVLHKKIIFIYFILILTFLAVSVYHHDYFNRILIKVLYMTTGMLICMSYPLKDYAQAFLKCMTFFSAAAIFLTMIAYISPSIVKALPSMINTAGVRFYSIGFAGLDERSLNTWNIRTGGIFWEPGVFQMYLNMAILLELTLGNAKNKIRTVIYIIALFLTFSTTGFLAFGWMIATYALFGRDNSRSAVKNIVIFIALIIGAIAVYFVVFYTKLGTAVFGKLFDMKDGSTMVRLASVLINLEIIRDHPFAGIGMEIMEDEFIRRSYRSSLIYGWTHQNTNTLLYQFSAHGCFFGIPFTFGTYRFGGRLSNKVFMKLSVFIMFLMLYIGENLMTSIFPYILIFYGVDQTHAAAVTENKSIFSF